MGSFSILGFRVALFEPDSDKQNINPVHPPDGKKAISVFGGSRRDCSTAYKLASAIRSRKDLCGDVCVS